MIDKVLTPPFKTQGIKTKLIPLIKQYAQLDGDTVWIEPFMGSGVVGLNVAKKNAIFADLNPHVINFYNQLKARKITSETVASYLYEQGKMLEEKDGEHYYYVRDRFNNEHNPLDFLFLNRSCFNGMVRFNKKNGFNVPYGHKPQRFAKAYVTRIVNQVRNFEAKLYSNNWEFVCQNFEKTIALADSNSFIYCDPPYIGRHVDYFDSWDEVHEVKLHECLLAAKTKFMLSTWDNNQYRKNEYLDTLWKDCYKQTQEHFYFVGAKEENRNPMIEALLTNYPTQSIVRVHLQETEQLALAI